MERSRRVGEWESGRRWQRGCLMIAELLLAAWICPSAHGQTLLRWKLKEGEAFTVEVEQQTKSVVTFSAKSATTTIDLKLSLGWKVGRGEGEQFVIRQTVDRIQQRLTTRDAGMVEFDSASTGRPMGQAKELADALKPVVGAEFEMVMTSRGDITSVEPANEAAKALVAAAESGADGASQATVRQMLGRPLAVLPQQEVKSGDTWMNASERTTAAGPLKLETTYQLESVDGQSIAKIVTKAKVTPGTGSDTRIKEHPHQGTVLFSVAGGRVVDIEQKQKLVTERPYRETTISVTLDSLQTTRLRSQ